MRMKFFTVPVFDGDAAAGELDGFLSTHRILSIDRQFLQEGHTSAWCLCIGYIDAGDRPQPVKRGKVDYKELLSEIDFAAYAKLRDLRKKLAEQDGVPVYSLFTNEQMAAMVRQQVNSGAQLLEIDGIGAGRVQKYGQAFLHLLDQIRSEATASRVKDDEA